MKIIFLILICFINVCFSNPFFVRKYCNGLYKYAESIIGYKYENNYLRASWIKNYQGGGDENVKMIKKNDYYLIKVNDKYLRSEGDWISGVDNYNSSSYYILEQSKDLTTCWNKDQCEDRLEDCKKFTRQGLYYIKDKNSGYYLCMDDDGFVNVKNSGYYILTYFINETNETNDDKCIRGDDECILDIAGISSNLDYGINHPEELDYIVESRCTSFTVDIANLKSCYCCNKNDNELVKKPINVLIDRINSYCKNRKIKYVPITVKCEK